MSGVLSAAVVARLRIELERAQCLLTEGIEDPQDLGWTQGYVAATRDALALLSTLDNESAAERVERLEAVIRSASQRLYPVAVWLEGITVNESWEEVRGICEREVGEVQGALVAAVSEDDQ